MQRRRNGSDRPISNRVRTAAAERARLVRTGLPLRDCVGRIVTRVHPKPFAGWVNHA
jgi:hypothetical protein